MLRSSTRSFELPFFDHAFVDLLVMITSYIRKDDCRESLAMRAFLSACLIAIVLAIAGYYALSTVQEPVSEAFSTNAVRLNS
jgi:hypothetical protein